MLKLRPSHSHFIVAIFLSQAGQLGCTRSEHSGSSESGDRPNILLVTIDTLRADHLPLYGYDKVQTPHLDALAAKSVVFDTVASHAPITLPSHASILTGLYPPQHGVRNNGSFHARAELVTMAEVLKGAGYRTAAFISAFVLDSRFGLDQGFDDYDDDLVDGRRRFSKFAVKDRRAQNTVNRVLEWLGAADSSPSVPFFIWTHLYDPHFPYEPPEPFLSKYVHPYDGEIAYTDQQIGRLVAGLENSGLLENTMVIITSDHGESLGEHGERTHSVFIYDATQNVPLIIKLPKAKHGGRRVTGLVRHIDILPTVAAVLGIEPSDYAPNTVLPGLSLLSRMSGVEKAPMPQSYAEAYLPLDQFGWSALYSWRDQQHKFIEAPRAELYDLGKDPHERKNLAAAEADKTKAFAEKLERLRDQLKPVAGDSGEAMDGETIANLKALGYISDSEPSQSEQGRDPKDMVDIYEAREEAHRYLESAEYLKAIPILQGIIARDPSNPSTHGDLATVYAELGRWPEATREFTKARELAPGRSGSYRGLTKVYFKGLRDFASAKRELDAAFVVAPHDPSLWTLRGDLLHAKGDMPAAAAAYQKAVDGGVQDASLFAGYASALSNLGQYPKARQMVEEALRIDDQNAVAHYNRGVILTRLGESQVAVTAYRDALRLAPTNTLSHENLGELLAKSGKTAQAAEVFEMGLKVDPQAAGLLYQLGSLHVRAGRVDVGIELLERASIIRPKSAPTRTNLGYAYHLQKRYNDAFRQYQALTLIYPKDKIGHADAWLRLARLRAEQGRRDEALRLLNKAIATGGEAIRRVAQEDANLKLLLAPASTAQNLPQ